LMSHILPNSTKLKCSATEAFSASILLKPNYAGVSEPFVVFQKCGRTLPIAISACTTSEQHSSLC
jgi:hypothetical protein